MGARYLKYEEDTIRNCFPTATRSQLLQSIPNRTWSQILAHANRMDIHRTTKAKGNSIREGRKKLKDTWSDADNAKVDMLYPISTLADLAVFFPHRTLTAILTHACRRNLHRTRETINREIGIGRKNARAQKEREER
ncbi:MAG: hypothetical protein U9N61_00045 [Euryarchaeota archaeon]|nr:hypothetical protein [Euryarchaeota archaeon]